MVWNEDDSVLTRMVRRAGLSGVPPRVLLLVAVACVAVVVVAALRWWPATDAAGAGFSIDEEIAVDPAEPEGASNGGESTVTEEPGETAPVVVHVAGAVMRPGLVSLPGGSRCGDAVDAVGGLTGNAAASSVNLARVLVDGEQIYVPTLDEVASGTYPGGPAGGVASGVGGAPTGSAGPAGAPGALVDLNTATAQELEALPGIGPSTAAKIIADRESNGAFRSVEDIQRVSGIGPKKYESLKELIVVR